jgi:pseudaminic acid synthase
MVKEIKIKNKKIGGKNPCFIIAEISANHNQNFELAKKTVKAACLAGADAVKLQTYKPETMTVNSKNSCFVIKANNPWKGKNLFELYKKTYMPWEWQPELKKIAESYGVVLFSAAYDQTAVDFLEKMNIPAYKIASHEIVDTELLKKVAQTRKPVFISRGMSTLEELEIAVKILKKNGAKDICIFHCVSAYPAKPEQMNLKTILEIKKKFKTFSGLSDHSLGIVAPVMSIAFGASAVEKHFTLSRANGAADASFSLEPEEFSQMVKSIREAEKSIGRVQLSPEKNETEIALRRSLFAVKDIKRGDKFTKENIKCLRPACGIHPFFLPEIIGKKAQKNIKSGTPLNKKMLKY